MSTVLKPASEDAIVPSYDAKAIHPTAAFLMCSPKFYEVNYVINPWMTENVHTVLHARAKEQWQNLYSALKQIADVVLIEPQPGLPDMAFTANAGLERDGTVVLSSFVHPERQGEEKHFFHWFQNAGYNVLTLPRDTSFEGEGDALFAVDGACLWAGYGFRTLQSSHRHLRDAWDIDIFSLNLVDPRFYHLDTCFAPLQHGYVMYYPSAFDETSIKKIETYYPFSKRIIVGEVDALRFACNVINVGRTVLLNEISQRLNDQLQAIGFDVVKLPLEEFLKAGGSAKCLVMKLSGTIHKHAH